VDFSNDINRIRSLMRIAISALINECIILQYSFIIMIFLVTKRVQNMLSDLDGGLLLMSSLSWFNFSISQLIGLVTKEKIYILLKLFC